LSRRFTLSFVERLNLNWSRRFTLSFVEGHRHAFRCTRGGGIEVMLHMALVFLVIGLIAALLGFTSIAGASIAIAKFLAGLFLVLFLVFLVIGLVATRRIVS
jgi:uncharacterized membrane protein YtjA (UPF0391 family)